MFSEMYLYLSAPQVACFDNDPPAGDPPAGDPPAGDSPAGDPPAGDPPAGDNKTFNQVDVNRIVQERLDRDRKSREVAANEKYTDLETRYSELLENENLGGEQRDKLNEQLEDVRKTLRTKDQQAAHEKKQLHEEYESKLVSATKAAEVWESRFRETTIHRELQDAASSNDAYEASQIVSLLRPMTKLVEVVDEITNEPTGDYNTVIDFPDVDEKEQKIITQRTPTETVQRMKELGHYANLFKSNVVSGVGAHPATGGATPGANGQIDVRKLTPEQYAKIRRENPAALGL